MMISFQFQKPIARPDGSGGEVIEWKDCGQIWGRVVFDEMMWRATMRESSAHKTQIRLRDCIESGIKRGYRLVSKEEKFLITDFVMQEDGDALIAAMREGDRVL